MLSRRFIPAYVFLGLLVAGWIGWRNFSSTREPADTPKAIVEKQPATVATRIFDPASPPVEMPALSIGENAECDSNFLSSANVGGKTRLTDSTHGTLTINQVKVTLHLKITIWVPNDVTQHVTDHEEGHRQISEYYFQGAEQIAERIAAAYLGRQIEISGADLNAEANKALLQTSHEIADEYGKEINPEATQLLYDSITDHGRSGVIAADAVSHALKNASIEAPQPQANRGN